MGFHALMICETRRNPMIRNPFRNPDWTKLHFLAALILTLILEGLNRYSVIGGFAFAVESPALFLFNALLVLDTLYLCLFFKRRLFVFLLVSALWLTAGIVNCVLVSYRTLPFTVIDITLLKDAIGLFDVYFNLAQRILIVAAGVAAVIALIVLFLKAGKTPRLPFSRVSGGALILAALSVGCLNIAMNARAISPSLNDLTTAYRQYGFAYCFMTTFVDVGVDKPENYSEEAIEAVEEQLETPQESNVDYPIRPNIVFVQLESFFDPQYITALNMKENPIPTFTQLKSDWPSGFLTMPSIGGGTANSEFEVLTGMALDHFGAGEYPYNTVLKETAAESVCYNLDKYGYTSHAVHNHSGSFYSRHQIYPNLGFDTFTSLEYMHDYEINSLGWANDSVLIDEIHRAIESTDEQDFVFCVTVQSHGHYPTEQVLEETAIADYLPDDASYWSLDYYIQEIAKVDAFLADLIASFEACDEPTVLVLYGDHLPSVGLTHEDLSNGSLYQTEYVLWNNYSALLSHISDRDLHAYQLSAYVTNLISLHSGDISRLHQAQLSGLLPEEVDYMNTLQLLEYDMLYGDNSYHDGVNPYTPTQMQMGLSPIRITSLQESDGALIVRGTGFTDHSEVFYHEQQIPTVYIAPDLLVATDLPEDGAPVSVCQIASDQVLLSTSNSMILPYKSR